MKMRLYCAAIFALALFVCSAEAGFELELKGSDQKLQMSFSGDKLKSAVEIEEFFVRIDDINYDIEGEPLSLREDKGGFTGVWKLGSRKVTVSVKSLSNRFKITADLDNDYRLHRIGMKIRASEKEYFTGMMERVVDGDQGLSWQKGITQAMNLRGESVEMRVKPSLGLYAPFYISSRGYGLFVHGTWQGRWSFPDKGDEGEVSFYFYGEPLEVTVYTGGVRKAVENHMMDTGPQFLPPKWAFKPWRWRDNHHHRDSYFDGCEANAPYNSELVEDVLMCEALDIPLGVYWVDRPWGEGPWGYDELEWDRQRLPEPEKMIQWLSRKDIKFMLWLSPWTKGPVMEETADENGWIVPGTNDCIDFSNPEAAKWWQENYIKKLLEDGVAGFKLDRGEERDHAQRGCGTIDDGRDWFEAYNDYSRMYAEAVYEISKEVRGDDFCLLPRAGYTGSAKYAAFWGGDTGEGPWGLRSAIVAALRSSVIGYPIWGSDTGGYRYDEDQPDTMMRWLAFSCFTPIMEVGPSDDKGLWDLKNGREITAVWRLYATLHDHLADYTYESAKQTQEKGTPVIRPLFLTFPDQQDCWDDWQSYMYGPDILVSPIWKAGREVARNVYLPAGESWVDAWTGREYEGGKRVEVRCSVHQIPIFTRSGAAVELPNLNQLWEESLEKVENLPKMSELEKGAKW
ncbi:TIM-barrel domain-containing protein [Sedimentisphaera salicampi]|uniref:TIM-barrel domain-containing protein n=1 Tax=Sedimentisphaera salicampi TaxID=1941349 RepID=UPI000B9C3AEA|nr:TIM-barrel domain-containing protein [Sedimentisphaera salicampi]OXU15159.1 Alpha-xylosidase [Sedimentisphaera salicampi]